MITRSTDPWCRVSPHKFTNAAEFSGLRSRISAHGHECSVSMQLTESIRRANQFERDQ